MWNNLLQSEHTWVNLSFLIFVVIFGKKIYHGFIGFLNEGILSIRSTVENSEHLFNHSREILKAEQEKIKHIEETISVMNKESQIQADTISENFFANLDFKEKYIKNKFEKALALQENTHKKQLITSTIEMCNKITISVFNNHITEKQKQDILDQSIIKLGLELKNLKKNTN